MPRIQKLDTINISVKSHKLLKQLLEENPRLDEIMQNANNEKEAYNGLKNWIINELKTKPAAYNFYIKYRFQFFS